MQVSYLHIVFKIEKRHLEWYLFSILIPYTFYAFTIFKRFVGINTTRTSSPLYVRICNENYIN